VLDPAITPRSAIAPNRLWLTMMALVAALLAGVVAIVVFERMDSSFHAPDDLRSFVRAPILATIPVVLTTAAKRRHRFRRMVATSADFVVLSLLAAGSWFVTAGNEMITRLTTRGV
jgi:uncharacterized membrane protein